LYTQFVRFIFDALLLTAQKEIISLFEGWLTDTWLIIANVLALIISLVILDKASHVTITNAVKVSSITGFGKTTVGFFLVGFSTSLPELCVSVIAALSYGRTVGVAVGNVLGSNIVNVCLIVGIAVVLMALRSSKTANMFPHITKEDMGSLYFGLLVASVIPLALVYITIASQIVGIILLVIFIVYTYQLTKIKTLKEESSLGEERRQLPWYGALTFSGAMFVVLSSFFIVDTASFLATMIGVPPVVIGATIIAFGTSIPELATSLKAVKQGHPEIAFGNIVGSCFINITLILGVPLIASPFRVDMTAFLDLVIFSLIANLFLWYFLTSGRISWREGAVLLCIYALFLATTFGVIQLR